MTTFVLSSGYVTEVRVTSHADGVLYDGVSRLQPSDILFGRAARLVQDGAYDDDGNYISSLEEFADQAVE